jgi:hypothetical protein
MGSGNYNERIEGHYIQGNVYYTYNLKEQLAICESNNLENIKVKSNQELSMKDVFICHASEDKPTVVEPLVTALEQANISYWYDKAEIQWGDSITQKVNEGLKISKFVIVVLSPAFLNKNFPQHELYSVLNIEIYSKEVKVLPLVAVSNKEEKENILKSLPILNSKAYETWDGNTDKIIQALLGRLPEKKTPKSESRKDEDESLNEIKLISNKGVEYHQLRNFLAAQKWLEADQETIKVLYQAINKQKFQSTSIVSVLGIIPNSLSSTDLKKLPEDDLIIIDKLWRKYSKRKFGISVQALIYQEEKEDYYSFCNRVGWRKHGRWVGYNDLNWSLNSPLGHLPWMQGIKMYPTEKHTRDFHFNSWSLGLGDSFFSSTEDSIISVLSQKVIDYNLF